MQLKTIALLTVLIALPGVALGQSSFFDDLLGARSHHTVHRSASKARPKAARPAAAPTDKAAKAPRDVFVYFIHEGKIRAPAAAMAFQKRVTTGGKA